MEKVRRKTKILYNFLLELHCIMRETDTLRIQMDSMKCYKAHMYSLSLSELDMF